MRRGALSFIAFSILCLTSVLKINADVNLELPYPYNSIEVLPFDPSAHFGPNQERGLSHLLKNNSHIKTVVEVGSYLGASTCFIATLLPSDGVVYAVDHWEGNQEWTKQPGFKEAQSLFYQKFLSNVIHKGLCEKIIPMKMPSVEAARLLTVVPDLVFLDGSHDFTSVYEDISTWFPLLEKEGILCGDDFNWGQGKPVKQAVEKFAKEHNLKVHVLHDWFWYYERY